MSPMTAEREAEIRESDAAWQSIIRFVPVNEREPVMAHRRELLDAVASLRAELAERNADIESLQCNCDKHCHELAEANAKIAELSKTAREFIDSANDHRGELSSAAALEAAIAPGVADDPSRCTKCHWPLAKRLEDGCIPNNCSMRSKR